MRDNEVCSEHPDRMAAAVCQRYGVGLCLECLEENPVCPDPEMFCRYRERCLVYFGFKEKQRETRKQAG
jgi:hypothetical protein